MTQSSDSTGEQGVKRQGAAMKGEGCPPQAARHEGHERKTAITRQDLTQGSVLRKLQALRRSRIQELLQRSGERKSRFD